MSRIEPLSIELQSIYCRAGCLAARAFGRKALHGRQLYSPRCCRFDRGA